MDISSISAQYLNSSYIPLSSSASSSPASDSIETGAFEELLRKVQNSGTAPQGGSEIASPLIHKTPIDKNDKLYELCVELEGFLIKNLVKSMRSTVQKSNLIDTGFAGEMYEDMLYDEYAKQFAKNANFGFAEMAYRDLAGLR